MIMVRPDPSEEEAAAIVAALSAFVYGGKAAAKPPPPSTAWRFSGRHWAANRFGTRTTR